MSSDARYGPIKGGSVLSLAGSISDSSTRLAGAPTVRTTSLRTQVGYGYFLTDQHEVGGNLAYLLDDSNVAGTDYQQIDLTGFYNYNIRQSSRTWFYVGVDGGLRGVNDDSVAGGSFTDLIYGAHVGMRNWLSPRTSLFIEPFYERSEFDTVMGDAPRDLFGILFGLEFAF